MKLIPKLVRLALLTLAVSAIVPAAQAQININIAPPSWGPAVPAGAQYYYIPETNGFYDVPARQYVVSRNGQWVRTSTLSGYTPANFHPVVVDYVGAQPWTRYEEYRVKYPKKGHPHGMPPGQAKKMQQAAPGQVIIYDKKGKGNGKHGGEGHGNGHGKGHK